VDERSLCQEHDVPLDEIDGDIVDGDLPDIGMVIPDVCHDAHDCPLRQADAWFADELQKIVDGPDWRSGQLAVVLTADEDDGGDDNRVLTVVIHPSQQGHVTSEPLTHYSLHQLFLDVLGLPAELDDPSMADAFGLPIAATG
jgi:acid phosphatase